MPTRATTRPARRTRRAVLAALTAASLGATAVACQPEGAVDLPTMSLTVSSTSITVAGWAWDEDTPTTPIDVHIYVNERGIATKADRYRPDVAAAKPGAGPNHGYHAEVSATPGTHRICVYGINAPGTPGDNQLLDCRTVTVEAPKKPQATTPPTTKAPTTTTTAPKPAPTTPPTTAPSATPPTTAPPAPTPPSTPAPAPVVGTRNPVLWPFASDSPWNTPIGSGAQLESTSGPMTSKIRSTSQPTKDGRGTHNLVSWVNASTYSHPIYTASNSDPLVTITAPWDPSERVRVPANAKPAEGSDGHMHIVQPDGRTLIELWTARWTSATTIEAGRIEVVDLKGSGIGPDNGVRAYGGSAIGGLIRKWEVDPSDPNYTDGVIRHAVAIALPASMLKYTGGNSGYDSAGNGTAKGYVWPATEQDYDSPYSYYGTIPMGQLFTIPKSVNVEALGLSPAAVKLAKAIQDYGAYVTDRVGDTTVSLYAEPNVPSSWLNDVIGPNWSGSQLTKIRQQMVAVTNNGPTNVGGGGTPLASLAPALR